MNAFTSIEQSKVLAEILPIESVDMCFNTHNNMPPLMTPYKRFKEFFDMEPTPAFLIPCWSLAALSKFILPYIADDDGNNYKFYLSKDGLDRWIAYYKSDDVSIHICEESDNMIDVILEMVYWLKKEEYI